MGLSDTELNEWVEGALTGTGHVEVDVSAGEPAEVDRVRKLVRRLAKQRGWKVRTFVSPGIGSVTGTATGTELEPAEPRVRVYAVVTEADPLHQQLWDVKGQKAMRRAVRNLL